MTLLISTVVTGTGIAIRDELIATGGGAVDRVDLMVPGDIAWDGCDCGQLAQSVSQVFPSNTFPSSAAEQAVTPCGAKFLVATVTASVVRCITGLGDSNSELAPTSAALLADALVLEADRAAIRKAVACYLKGLRDQYDIWDFAVGAVASAGPQGNCGGVQLTYQFSVSNDTCC